jgi:hypothetical protein
MALLLTRPKESWVYSFGRVKGGHECLIPSPKYCKAQPVNLIVVPDHGMQRVEGFVNIGEFADFCKLQVDDAGVFTLVYAPEA